MMLLINALPVALVISWPDNNALAPAPVVALAMFAMLDGNPKSRNPIPVPILANVPAPAVKPPSNDCPTSPPLKTALAAEPPLFAKAVLIADTAVGPMLVASVDNVLGSTVAGVVLITPLAAWRIALPSVNRCCTEPSASVLDVTRDASPTELVNSFANAAFNWFEIAPATAIPAYEIPADNAACPRSPPWATTFVAEIRGNAHALPVATAATCARVATGLLIALWPILPTSRPSDSAPLPISRTPDTAISPILSTAPNNPPPPPSVPKADEIGSNTALILLHLVLGVGARFRPS